MDVLWVCWFGLDVDTWGRWSKKLLHGISFIPWDEPGAFGFLDPAHVIRGVHLIPNFLWDWTESRLPPCYELFSFFLYDTTDPSLLYDTIDMMHPAPKRPSSYGLY